jgi:HEAT repeat protein
MKFNHKFFIISSCLIIVFALSEISIQASQDSSISNVIAAVVADDYRLFDQACYQNLSEKEQAAHQFLVIFKDPASSNFKRCAAAYYLGELSNKNAINDLASSISLAFKYDVDSLRIPAFAGYPAMDALVKMGSSSIPALIRNLTESKDTLVQDLSLQAIIRIDNDRDISQLRLQKAIKSETDLQKQTRLQSALASLAQTK